MMVVGLGAGPWAAQEKAGEAGLQLLPQSELEIAAEPSPSQ